MATDFITNIIDGKVSFSFKSSSINNHSFIINTLLRKGRVQFDENKGEQILEKGGCIIDVLKRENETKGSLIWYYKKNYQSNVDIIPYVKSNLSNKLLNLKNLKLISNFDIKNIYQINRNLYVNIYIQNIGNINLIY